LQTLRSVLEEPPSECFSPEKVGIFRKRKLELGKRFLEEIEEILNSEEIPEVIDKPKYKKCASHDFCFV
jgi:CRISPR/Cas system-associated exonuclease Cas4 (RecB family)